ncbi:MFS transporter [Rubellicoccus peritrichatus]|uniref:MFS transporter n=1 Tax=Rubellicoccus peritrichatus TaxID=3080537 RepID=A0AAQ3QVK6_9BACT|nr:MFS transporter [Puniceicoccus sp. CR14]WOO41718.1 MFS transporter [Puniceicoccus sp. CR14]
MSAEEYSDDANASMVTGLKRKTVQEYIDEAPVWPDGTATSLVPMTSMQWRIFALACAGKFFEGMLVFMTGVALPLISLEFKLKPTDMGFVTAATLAGILVGASALGGLADFFGRKKMFIIEMIIFTVFLTALTFSPNFVLLVIFLFGAGVALGCDYPTAHLVISESIPTKMRGRLVLGAFAFQAVGAFFGTGIGILILREVQEVEAWRWMYATAIIPAIFVIIGRFFVTESAHWQVSKGHIEKAEKTTARLLKRHPIYPKRIHLHSPHKGHEHKKPKSNYAALFNKDNRKATILASVPWFLQDLGTYGIGIFTPTILAAMIGAKATEHGLLDVINNDMLAAEGSAIMDIFFFIGIIGAILLVDKVGRIKLQILGFIGCAIGLLLAALSVRADGSNNMPLLMVGFTLFFFMTNLGPNAMTYLLAGEVFPTHVRGMGAGFAASFAKIGAVLTAFLFPVLLKVIGTSILLYGLVGIFVLGAVVTFIFAIETKGLNLEDIGKKPQEIEIEKERAIDAEIA